MIQQHIVVRLLRRAAINNITSIFFAMLMGSSKRLATIAFQHAYHIHIRPRQFHTSGSTRSSILSLQQTTTGWIRIDTLNFQEETNVVNNSNDDVDDTCKTIHDGDTKIQYPSKSPVECILIRDRLIHVKRDDVLHLPSSNVSGNKARKFQSLNNIPAQIFPDVITSYGGPQSNAMVALAAIVSSKNAELMKDEEQDDDDIIIDNLVEEGDDLFWQLDVESEEEDDDEATTQIEDTSSSDETIDDDGDDKTSTIPKKRFIYYTKNLPRYLRKNPNGNLLRAMSLGMEIRTVSHEEYNNLFGGLHGGSVMAPADLDPPVEGQSLWIPQGGACRIAKPGSNVLAREIVDYWAINGKNMPLAVCLPGGTCTTALLLHQSINRILEQRKLEKKEELDIRTIVIPCVGDDQYAKRQMVSLDKSVGGNGRVEDLPYILKPRENIEYGSVRRRRSNGYFTFGEPAKAILDTFDELNEEGLCLDLLYGAPAMSLLLQHWKSKDLDCPIAGRQIMYVHSGGLEGISSQITRYKHKGLLESRNIQSDWATW